MPRTNLTGPLTIGALLDHARRDAIQACVLLVTKRFGDEAGEWLLSEIKKVETRKGGLAKKKGCK